MKKFLLILGVIMLIIFGKSIYNETLSITKYNSDKKIYLALNGEIELPSNIINDENEKIYLMYKSDNEYLKVNDNIIKGVKEGKASLEIMTSKNEEISVEVIVTNLISEAKIDNDKPYIKCGEYTKEEADTLEVILEYRINEGGYNTRAGALSAARFLLLEFKNRLYYFNENGRLENHSNILHIDAEGRYYHKGLYLTEDKYESIVSSTKDGPKMWGCPLHSVHYNKDIDNGLNCSGFITWTLYNAGFDIKDVGAGDFEYIHNELLDLRPKEKINMSLLNSSKIKPGDLIGFDGHIAMIIGMEENKIYIGESYETGTRVRTFTYKELINSDFTDIILMDDYYKEDGNYNNMW